MTPVGQLVLEGAIARRHAHRMARELAGAAENPIGALEELTGGKMLLILLGVGAIGGGIYYLATKKPAAAAPPAAPVPPGTVIAPSPSPSPATAATAPAAQAAAQVLRPAAPGTFGASIPPGSIVTVTPGQTPQVTLRSGGFLTLVLPTSASWQKVLIANSASPSTATSVDLLGDVNSPVSIPRSMIVSLNANVVGVSWTGAGGQTQTASVIVALG
jgi:hypothetical protein